MSISYCCNPPYDTRWPYRPSSTPLSITQNVVILLLITVQRDATQNSLFIILQVHSTCFGCQSNPSSGVHKTVTTAYGTGHVFLCSYLPPTWPLTASWREAVVTVLCTPDDGCG